MHRIEFKDLLIFIRIAENGSFQDTALSVHLSQPAVTRRMQKLEEVLGVELFKRTTRKTELTRTGIEFLPKARRMMEDFELSVLSIKEMATNQKGTVVIACIPTAAFYFLPRVIKEFNSLYPNIRIKIMDVSAKEGLELVLNGHVDFGINMEIAQYNEILFTPLLEDSFVVCVRRDHPLATKKSVEMKDLSDYKLIGVSRDSGNRTLMDLTFNKLGLTVDAFYEVQHLSTSLGLVEMGLGVAIVPSLSMPVAGTSDLLSLPLKNIEVSRTIGLVRLTSSSISSAAELFIDTILSKWARIEQ